MLGDGTEVGCRELIVADGARSTLGRVLGREWHQETVYGVAIRGYIATPRATSRGSPRTSNCAHPTGDVLPGYGWIFPLGNGEVNIGVGALATAKRPADAALRPLMSHYTDLRRDEWGFDGEPRAGCRRCCRWAARCPGVAGPNWMLIGDAAACVNPLNGEGIDYGLETGRLAADLLGVRRPHAGLARGTAQALRPRLLGRAPAGAAADHPPVPAAVGPLAMRSQFLMGVAVRVMGNLVTDEDADWIARVWRRAGAGSSPPGSAQAVQLSQREKVSSPNDPRHVLDGYDNSLVLGIRDVPRETYCHETRTRLPNETEGEYCQG